MVCVVSIVVDMDNTITITGSSNTKAEKTVTLRTMVRATLGGRNVRIASAHAALGMLHSWGTPGAPAAHNTLTGAAADALVYA
jgi:hypothetical protein